MVLVNFTSKMNKKIDDLGLKLVKVRCDVEIVRKEAALKSASSARILQSMESLRLESVENTGKIAELKRQNADLLACKYSSEHTIEDLRRKAADNEKAVGDMQKLIVRTANFHNIFIVSVVLGLLNF